METKLLETMKLYVNLPGISKMNTYMLMIDMLNSGMTPEEVNLYFEQKLDTHRTVHTLSEGDKCFILKEDGSIIETAYKCETYFENVKLMGNLFLTWNEAEHAKAERLKWASE